MPQLCFIDSKFVTRNVVCFTNEKNFYLNRPVSNQNNRVWAGGKKADVWLNVRSLHNVWWSQLACFGGKGRLHFVDKNIEVDSAYYVSHLLLSLVNDCTRMLSSGYIFQHTQLVLRRTGSEPTAQISLRKISGLQIHPTWNQWITLSGEGQCWRPITINNLNQKRNESP